MKFIAMDMDGTLLDNNHSIPPENIEAIKKAQALGVYAVISTGRVYDHVKDFLKEHNFTPDFVISSNGACITDKNGKLLFSRPLPKETLLESLNFLHKNDFFYSLSTDNGMLSPNDGFEILDREALRMKEKDPNADISVVYSFVEYVKQLGDCEERGRDFETLLSLDCPVYSIPVLTFDKFRQTQGREGLKHLKDVTLDSSAFNNFEIVNANASKGIAINYLLDKLNISTDDAMALGDNYNDISMFNVVKYSIAMGNSPEDIKKICYFTTKSNIEFGVAYAIEKFVL
ncbi:MAG: Cof-type HAD-IIB family hydrolase [Clostridium sp.]